MTDISYKLIPNEEETEEEEEEELKNGSREATTPEHTSATSSSNIPLIVSTSVSTTLSSCWRQFRSAFSVVPFGATPLPAWPIAMASLAIFNCILHMTVLFPFVPQMLRSFHIDESEIGELNTSIYCHLFFLSIHLLFILLLIHFLLIK